MWRMESDAADEEDRTRGSKQPLQSLRCLIKYLKSWVLAVYREASAIVIDSFFTAVVKSVCKDRNTTLLPTAPPCLAACIVCVLVSWDADRARARHWQKVVLLAVDSGTSLGGLGVADLIVMIPWAI